MFPERSPKIRRNKKPLHYIQCQPFPLSLRYTITKCSAAGLVVILARANLANRLLDVVRQLELALLDERLALDLRLLRVPLRLRLHLRALSCEVGRVHVAVLQEDRHAVLRLAANRLELLHEAAEAITLNLDVTLVRLVRAPTVGSTTLRIDGAALLRLRGLFAAAAHKEHRLTAGHSAESSGDQRHAERHSARVRLRALWHRHFHDHLRLLHERRHRALHRQERLLGSDVRRRGREEARLRNNQQHGRQHLSKSKGSSTITC